MTAHTLSLADGCGSGDRGLPGVSRVRPLLDVLTGVAATGVFFSARRANVLGFRYLATRQREYRRWFSALGAPEQSGRRWCVE